MKRNRTTPIVLMGILALAGVTAATAADSIAITDSNSKVTVVNARDLMIETPSESTSLKLHFAGADRIDFGPIGELSIVKTNGDLVHYRPDVYQVVKGKFRAVGISYKLKTNDCVTLNLSKLKKDVPVILHRGAATM